MGQLPRITLRFDRSDVCRVLGHRWRERGERYDPATDTLIYRRRCLRCGQSEREEVPMPKRRSET